jgi:hypothetical protein
LWCAPFVPHFKQLVAPIEALLSPKAEGTWTEECTRAVNELVRVIFAQIHLHQADPYGALTFYPSAGDQVAFLAATQVQGGKEVPVAFLSRYMTATELKWTQLERTVAIVSWGVRKLRRYTTTASSIEVAVDGEEEVAVLLERAQHLRLKAFLLELQMYKVRWVAKSPVWQLGKGVVDLPVELGEAGEQPMDPPQMLHKAVQLKRKQQVSASVEEVHLQGVAVLTFDGGSAKKLGTGGFTCWLPTGQLVTAQALWYGAERSTNNEAELATLKAGLQWLADHR